MLAGEKRGPYEIVEPIGKGGMGEVYRARDTRVGRDVAIKVSAERFGERFEREVQTIASLNHPNICTLYDVGPDYLVMELIEGEAPQGPMPLETALDYAKQIAAALEAAHDRGIVHRDLKPGNIKITPDGRVKVLDFGLAKVVSAPSSSASVLTSPTFSMAATQAGMIVGTAAYMAPEQARGQIVDKRADIWAFGVVLYEMLTGKRLFQGEDLTDTIAAVVRDKPDLSDAPPQVRRVLEKCLEKDPKKRLRDITGVQLLLESQSGIIEPPSIAAQKTERPSSKLPWIIAAVAMASLAVLAVFVSLRRPATAANTQAVTFSLDAPLDSVFANEYGAFAPSPDGRYVVFAARTKTGAPSLWLRPLDSLVARTLPGTEAGNFPTWSPDSRSIAFLADGKLKRIEITGGAPLTLADAGTGSRVTATGTWNRDGIILFGSAAGLQRVSASGGGANVLIKTDAGKKEAGLGYPQFLPDGNHFIYFVDSSDPNVQGVYASSLKNPEQRQEIVRAGAKAVFVPARGTYPDYLLWMQNQTLLAQRFDLDKLAREGDPISVAEDVGLNPGNQIRAAFWASDAGLLVYFVNPELRKQPLSWLARDGKSLGEVAEDNYLQIARSPVGDRVAISRSETTAGRSANIDIWIRELTRGVMTRLTFDPGEDRLPVWSPDGKQIVFSSNRENSTFQLYRKDASGSGAEERLTEGPNSKLALDWSKDGKYILYREDNPKTGRDLMALPLTGDRTPIPVVNTPFMENTVAISPDGRWVAYSSNDSGQNELYIQAFPGLGGPKGRWQVSNGGGYEVKWRADGKELYWETNTTGMMMAAGIQAGPDGVRVETPRTLFMADFNNGSLHQFDVTPDGQRFLIVLNLRAGEGANQRLTVVTNWQAALRK
jgi:eukaryotic-like serine/threonine-protein kinase